MLRTPRQPKGLARGVGSHWRPRSLSVSHALCQLLPTYSAGTMACTSLRRNHSQHPAGCRVQVKWKEPGPLPASNCIALLFPRSLHSPYIHLSLNYNPGN